MRLDQVHLHKEAAQASLLRFYMGENTQDRQNFIIQNLRIEQDIEEDLLEETN